MVCWLCAGISFWGAAALLGIYAVASALGLLRRSHGRPHRTSRSGMGHPAG